MQAGYSYYRSSKSDPYGDFERLEQQESSSSDEEEDVTQETQWMTQ